MNWLIYVVLLHLPFILFLMIKEKILRYQLIKKICDGFEISLGEFFSHPLFDTLEQEIR